MVQRTTLDEPPGAAQGGVTAAAPSWPYLAQIALFLGVLAGSGCARAEATVLEPFQGIVEFEDRTLAFEIGGKVRRLSVRRGAAVEANAVVVELDDELDRHQRDVEVAQSEATREALNLLRAGTRREEVASAEGELAAAAADEVLASKTLERSQKLAKSGALAHADLDEAEARTRRTKGRRRAVEQRAAALRRGPRPEELAAAEARLRASEAAVKAIDARLAERVLRTPIAGVALEVHVEEGEVVQAGAPVATIGDVQSPRVVLFVPEPRIASLRLGAAVSVRIDGGRQYAGVVEEINRNMEFTPRFLFSDRERPNLVVRARVRIKDGDSAIHAGVPAFVTLR